MQLLDALLHGYRQLLEFVNLEMTGFVVNFLPFELILFISGKKQKKKPKN